MSRSTPHVAVLGAGILGSCLALFLARGGARVTLFDQRPEPLSAASCWNEGKIHLGHLYAGDPRLGTAKRLLPDSLQFRPLLEDLLEQSLSPAITREGDIYLCHRDSVAAPNDMARYFRALDELIAEHPGQSGYLSDLTQRRSRALSANELSRLTQSPDIVAGFQVLERSVSTLWIAERLTARLREEPLIDLRLNQRVEAVERSSRGRVDYVKTPEGSEGPFSHIVNALWEGRLAIDRTAGLQPSDGGWSHRYRLSLFARTEVEVALPSMVIATGPFGDVKNYDGRNLYLSWYQAGLQAQGEAPEPPPVPSLDESRRAAIGAEILERLGTILPAVAGLRDRLAQSRVEGGWVFAQGQGALDDPNASIHRRDRFGVLAKDGYLSVDTGKYSSGPALAQSVAQGLLAG